MDNTDTPANLITFWFNILLSLILSISWIWPLFDTRFSPSELIFGFITPILKSLVVPVIWLALIDAIFSRIAAFFALNRIFFPSDQISRLAWSKQPNCRKWKTKSIMWQILQLLSPKNLIPPLPKWMNLISKQLSTALIKYLTWPSPVFGRFQNGWDEVMIEPRVVQFWAEIILVILEIMRMISAQIALHSVQLLL